MHLILKIKSTEIGIIKKNTFIIKLVLENINNILIIFKILIFFLAKKTKLLRTSNIYIPNTITFFLSKSFNSYSMSHISQTYEVQNIQTTMWFLHVLILLLIIRWIFCIKRINKLIFQQADDCYSNT
jgi:hypothetical protein